MATEMSGWSASVYSEPSATGSSLLAQLDASLYEGVPMQDPALEAEAREWASRFVHLRVVGSSCPIHPPSAPYLPPVAVRGSASAVPSRPEISRLPSLVSSRK